MNNSRDSILHTDNGHRFMQTAIKLARQAEENGDVPVGCVIVHQNKIIARSFNQRQMLNDPTAHAEMIALTQACDYIGNWRLHGCSVYVTLEPCSMCAGAMVLARVDNLIYACDDPKTGACGSLYNIVQDDRLNHRVNIKKGLLAEECSAMLTGFFRKKRKNNPSSFS